ncbi:phosphotransferase RcsD [Enterobacteriaceae bacterium ESL0689]|nr:phosphotransferase RcsD [Enterobacteriaceae bacterium ESL0689]
MIAKKLSFIANNPGRFFILIISLLLLIIGVMVHNAIHGWLEVRNDQIITMSHALQQRMATWRYATWQIYDDIAALPASRSDNQRQEMRLQTDVYALEKSPRKTEALIFGSHDNTSLEIADIISRYFDILWGAETLPWSMYYLNGVDNSLILVSTLPLRALLSHAQEPSVTHIVASRRGEMLLQANTLDQRETFSALRYLPWHHERYFTLRTTFNQPGLLATVIALDMPINDLIPPGMSADNFRIESETTAEATSSAEGKLINHIDFVGSRLAITMPVDNMNMRLIWEVPLTTLIAEVLQNNFLLVLLMFCLLIFMLSGLIAFRHTTADNRPIHPAAPTVADSQSLALQALNEEIISQLPLGLLVHDQQTQRTVISNPLADHLLPHLNLSDIITIADQHQGVIQLTIDNKLYEIRQYHSQVKPQIQVFIIRNQDQELLTRQKLKQAQRLYEKNRQGYSAFMQHITSALTQPLLKLAEEAAALDSTQGAQLEQHTDQIRQLVDEMQLAHLLESDNWQSQSVVFSFQTLLDDIVTEILPFLKRKGLQLLVNNTLPVHEHYYGDRNTLHHILLLLIQYAVTTTSMGKITLDISQQPDKADQLIIHIRDTGNGMSRDEVDNIHFPFLHETQSDRYGKANALTFWLCNRLVHQLQGQMNITSCESLGTHYTLALTMAVSEEKQTSCAHLLNDMMVMLDITASEVRQIVSRQLTGWGANCMTSDERPLKQPCDLFLTDNPDHLTTSGILLTADEIGIGKISQDKLRVNFNISSALQEAILYLIERQLAQPPALPSSSLSDDSRAMLHASGYYALFIDTVPDDLRKLYTEVEADNFTTLAQITHRLKGVFAMLNLNTGKQLCEIIEHLISEKKTQNIKKHISELDNYVKSLL